MRFAGKVGTGPGFTAVYLEQIRRELAALEQQECPFTPAPPGWIGRHGRWVSPVRRGSVVFTEWTEAGTLRHPTFQGFLDTAPEAVPSSSCDVPPSKPSTSAPALRRGLPPPPGAPGARSSGRNPPGLQSHRANASPARPLSSPNRLIYPDLNFSKGALAEFYAQVAPWMLPYIKDRPLTLVRCAGGVRGSNPLRDACQFLPHDAAWYRWATPPIRRVQIPEQQKIGEYLVVDSLEGLVELVQGDIIELHCWNSTIGRVETPDRIVFDLDPGDGVTWAKVIAGAQHVRALLKSLGLSCWPKLSGGKGVHVVVPFQPEHGWDAIYALAFRIAQAVMQRNPTAFTLDFAKEKRAGKILLDYKRNHRGATAVAAYSARARPNGTVGVPVSWRELQTSRAPDRWTVRNMLERLAKVAQRDPWADFFECRQRLGPH